MSAYNVAEAKAHLSEILEKVLEGEEVILTRRGQPVARVVPVEKNVNILGAGTHDPNINLDVLATDAWWQTSDDDDARKWYE
jgi:prevent-host-death family protein